MEEGVERWEPLPEAPYVQVSDMGRVRTLGHFGVSGRWVEGRLLRASTGRGDYACVNLAYPDGRRRTVMVHRLVARLFVPNPDPARLTEVDHLNADHQDARAANLEWVTPEENKRRAREMGITGRRLARAQAEVLDSMAGSTFSEAARAAGCSVGAARDYMRGGSGRSAVREDAYDYYGSYELDEAALGRVARALAAGVPATTLARRFGVSAGTLKRKVGDMLTER